MFLLILLFHSTATSVPTDRGCRYVLCLRVRREYDGKRTSAEEPFSAWISSEVFLLLSLFWSCHSPFFPAGFAITRAARLLGNTCRYRLQCSPFSEQLLQSSDPPVFGGGGPPWQQAACIVLFGEGLIRPPCISPVPHPRALPCPSSGGSCGRRNGSCLPFPAAGR